MSVGVYDDNGGIPDNLLANSNITAWVAAMDWQTIDLTAPLAITNGVTVHLAWSVSEVHAFSFSANDGGFTRTIHVGPTMEDPWSVASSGAARFSIYANVRYAI